ncbi:MAG: hypothetical protein Q7J27_00610 [Syntrophales bacterium]|nr:hypothetical protein [Syntrophales bacterium]
MAEDCEMAQGGQRGKEVEKRRFEKMEIKVLGPGCHRCNDTEKM